MQFNGFKVNLNHKHCFIFGEDERKEEARLKSLLFTEVKVPWPLQCNQTGSPIVSRKKKEELEKFLLAHDPKT